MSDQREVTAHNWRTLARRQRWRHAVVFAIIFGCVWVVDWPEQGGRFSMQTWPLLMPWVLAVLLALGLTLAVKGLLPARRNQPKEKPDPAAYRKVLATLLVLALGIAAMPWIGFVLGSIAIYTLISMLIAPTRPRSPKGWAQTLVIAAIASGVFYAVFRYVLMVPLPTGTWFG